MKRDPLALEASLAELERGLLKRRRATLATLSAAGEWPSVTVDGRHAVDFCSNDYLALARHPDIARAMADAARRHGAGSGASHLVAGHGVEHEKLEEELASFTGRARALLFSTGYMANLSVIGALAGRDEVVLLDRLSHASLIDAALLSRARLKRFAHADPAAAERALLASGGAAALVATDGVFSMDGDVAPLAELARLSRAHQCWLVVDDAHGLGVLGASGRGLLEQCGLDAEAVPVLIGTLGKAFGTFGAFAAGATDVIELLLQKARAYAYTTALPQPIAAATRQALAIAAREPWRRERVLKLARRFSEGAKQLNVPVMASTTPIQPVLLGSTARVLRAQEGLLEAGFWVVAIRPPTVPSGSSRLRVALSAGHSEDQVDALVEALGRIVARLPS
ncbi:MAG TPA: 8-amino-7-oxononanoate synthase [Steroidobacteraceae bacterium]|jgi:8-amino-7-oxononanoate synthase